MRYYNYISESKLEMLYEQVPHRKREKLAAELNFDFGVISGGFRSTPIENARHQKIEITRLHLQGRTGQPGEKKTFIYGQAFMSWGPYDKYEEVVYFGGNAAGCYIGLMGSMRNCIGFEGLDRPSGYSSSGYIVGLLSRRRCLPPLGFSSYTRGMPAAELERAALRAVEETNVCSIRPSTRMLFWAKAVSFRPAESADDSAVFLGSPIFVAEVEDEI